MLKSQTRVQLSMHGARIYDGVTLAGGGCDMEDEVGEC